MEKYFVEGRGYGVLISPDYGLGFSTEAFDKNIAIDKRVIEAAYACAGSIEKSFDRDILRKFNHKKFFKLLTDIGDWGKFTSLYLEDFHSDIFYVRFLPKGTLFRIGEYDGAEYIDIFDPDYWIQF